jgi:hypothetical protein
MGIPGGYHSVGRCYWGEYHFIFHGCTRNLPRYALPIRHPHYSLTSESAKSMPLGLGCFVDIPGGVNSLFAR